MTTAIEILKSSVSDNEMRIRHLQITIEQMKGMMFEYENEIGDLTLQNAEHNLAIKLLEKVENDGSQPDSQSAQRTDGARQIQTQAGPVLATYGDGLGVRIPSQTVGQNAGAASNGFPGEVPAEPIGKDLA